MSEPREIQPADFQKTLAGLPNQGQNQPAQVMMQRNMQSQWFMPPLFNATEDASGLARDYGLMNMNPIARAKYEDLFALLNIEIRYTTASMSNSVLQWVIAKIGKDGRIVRQEWTAPSRDPGCSLRTWDAMVAELLDEVARRDGAEIKHDNTADPASAGQQVASGAGHP